MKKKIHVALLFGGRSAEHEVSLNSAKAIYNNLDKNKYEVLSFYISKGGRWAQVENPLLTLPDLNQKRFFSFLPWESENLNTAIKADIYFPVLHGPFGEDGTIQGLLELAGAPFVGATVLGSAAGMDKAITKILFKAHDLPITKYKILFEPEWKEKREAILESIPKIFSFPYFVKPANMGSSVGITKIKDFDQTEAAINNAFLYDRKILIEEGITGREFECSVLGNDFPKASLPGEIIPFREFYDYRDKYIEGKTEFRIPADIPTDVAARIQDLSVKAFKSIGCTGMARVDFFMQANTQQLYINEINTIPGFTEISMYPKLWEVSGLTFPELLEDLIELGFKQHRQKKVKVNHENSGN